MSRHKSEQGASRSRPTLRLYDPEGSPPPAPSAGDVRARLQEQCDRLDVPGTGRKPDCGCGWHLLSCAEAGCAEEGCERQHWPEPCRHTLQAEHDFGWQEDLDDDAANQERQVVEWGRLLELAFGAEEYGTPPAPAAPALVLSRQARVAVLAERHGQGLCLYHPLDSWRAENQEHLKVGAVSLRPCGCDACARGEPCELAGKPRLLRNGARSPTETLAIRKAA